LVRRDQNTSRQTKRSRQSGLSLVEVVVALGISGIMGAVAWHQMERLRLMEEAYQVSSEIIDVAMFLSSQTNCSATLKQMRLENGGNNPPVGAFVKLTNRRDLALTPEAGTGVFSGSGRVLKTQWYVQSNWVGHGISVRIAKMSGSGSGSFALHPSTGSSLDFSQPKHQIYAERGLFGVPLCAGDRPKAFNFVTTYTRTRDVAPFLGMPVTTRCHTLQLHPLNTTRSCHSYCRSVGYSTGYMATCSDHWYNYDVNGVLVDVGEYAPGEAYVECSCLK
jgi:hypothetical protein